MSKALQVVYSAEAASLSSGFSHYVCFSWKPRRELAQRFVGQLRADRNFPRHIQTRGLLTFWLNHRRTLPWERRVASDAWRSYAEWKAQKQAA